MKINNRGAASILVILIVLVLATFGGIAITSGWTNKKLAIKSAQSKIDFYALDSAAEKIVAETDEILYFASYKTQDYLNSLIALSDISKAKEDKELVTLFASKNNNISSKAMRVIALNDVYRRIYFYESAKALSKYAKENGLMLVYYNEYVKPEDFLDAKKKVPQKGDLKLEFQISSGDKPGQKSLSCAIAVLSPQNDIKIINDESWQTDSKISQKQSSLRYMITAWKQNQNPIDYEVEPQYID